MRAIFVAAAALAVATPAFAQDYFPSADSAAWERRDPAAMGFDPEALAALVAFAVENETRHDDPELEAISPASNLPVTVPLTWSYEPFSSPIGPLKARGGPAGIILRDGYIVAEWGDLERVDMTFSVSKTFLSHVVGLAVDDGLIASVHDPVSAYVEDPLFHTDHNAPITWDQMLRQTSGWWGELFGKPAWADRPDRDDPASDLVAGPPEPGSAWEYNDVRVNALALAALYVWRRPLPEVLEERIMGPIGASGSWIWHGYENSFVEIDGQVIQSVSGGGHWGGGMWLSAYDQARLGLLGLNRGRWEGEPLLSDAWFEASLTPTDVAPGYGYMNFFLNRPEVEGAAIRVESAPESAFAYLGAGTNMIYVDPEHEIVAVVRWIDGGARNEFIARLTAAITD
ncbi:class C beta-lactamase-related serine hydrolase [Marinicauda algicola]|uniref:Class C beta-lactamase-related serine hydrolase n=1 Tax=Marinicauda algicola TaxID=2029849 RepID=A0A4S2GXS1_9PROT|nr:serine hydrolase [Marinicauda algicola]TGY87935.1 class C beta-lactamase-related serine hydrolase [Marinicauda algicola]